MELFRKSSIKNKLIIIIMLICSLVIVFGFSIVFINNIVNLKKDMVNRESMNARLIGEYCVTALDFNYPERATEILNKLQSLPEIHSGHVYDEEQNLFASYTKSGEQTTALLVKKEASYQFEGDYLHIWEPIIFQGEKYGTIYLKSNTSLSEKIKKHFLVLSLSLLGLLLLTYLFAVMLQRIISRPIQDLTGLAGAVSSKGDYSLRAKKKEH